MKLGLKDKRVFISGSTSGIGYSAAQVFLNEGAAVYINGRTKESVSKASEELKNKYPASDVKGYVADFSNKESIAQLIKELPEIDILINNVGIYSTDSFFETEDDVWLHQYEVNVMSGVRLSRHFLPKMMDKNWGRILFVSSECATLVPAELMSYSATKAAILAVSRGLAQLTQGSSVTVNTVLPGSTKTERAQQFLAELAAKENKTIEKAEKDFFKEARQSSLLQRFATVEEIANTIVYLSSPLSAATNGAVIKLDGGSTGGII